MTTNTVFYAKQMGKTERNCCVHESPGAVKTRDARTIS